MGSGSDGFPVMTTAMTTAMTIVLAMVVARRRALGYIRFDTRRGTE
jgi:hypothetical protein